MIRLPRICVALILLLAALGPAWRAGAASSHGSSAPGGPRVKKPAVLALVLHVAPGQIKVGRDVLLTIQVTDTTGRPVAGAVVSVTGTSRPVIGTTARGQVTLTVHAAALGTALVQADHAGYEAATVKVPIVLGAPATVAAVKVGLSVLAPRAKPVPGKAGTDLMAQYHALTGKKQFASLALRDGTLVDMDSNTDVVIKDPLHMTLSGGELFLEVVHGAASHQVQVGTVVAATKGTRLDVRVDPKTKAAVVTVIEGKVQVSNKGKSVLVGAGQQSTVLPNGPPAPPQPANLTPILGWIANLPNSTPTVVPPVLNLPQPPPVQVALPPIGQQATMTATNPLQTAWSGVVLVPNSATLPAGSTLTIQPGTVVQMGSGVTLDIQGTLIATGSATAPIIFTSASSTPKPGDWQYVTLDGTGATGSVLSDVQMFDGSWNGGDDGMLSVTGGAKPSISNSVFAQATNYGVWADDNSLPTISNCVFAADATAAISVSGDAAGLVSGTRLGPNQAGIEVRNTTISQNTTWHQQDAPFVLDGGTLGKNFTLTITPGTVIRMASGATYDAQGTLLALGTASAPIMITSNAANPAPGDWQYITIDGLGATASALAYVQMFYGSWNGGDDGMLSVTSGAKPSISNSVFAQATNYGVWADDDSRPTINNCIFAGDATSAISVPADDAARVSGTSVGPNQAGIEVRNTTITDSGTWNRQNAPYIIDGGTLSTSASISIAAGTVLEMARGATFDVQGTLLVDGTANAPVIVTSAAGQPRPGDWQYITIDGPKASGSVLNYLQVFYGSWNGGDDGMISVTSGATPTISNSVFAQATNYGVWADNDSRPTITNCAFVGDASSALSVPADDAALITGTAVGPGQVGIEVRNTPITHSGTWQQQSAPFVLDGATLSLNVTLTIAPGTLIQMASGATFDAQGTLLASGTANAPIIITSAKQQPKPGDWQYVTIDGPGAGRSIINYVQFFYGSWNGGDDGMLSITGGASPTISNSLFAQATNYGIWADDSSHPTISSCMFTNLGAAALSVPQADKANLSGNTFGPGQKGPEIRS